MKHLGDITKIKGCDAPVVDCIIGGSPCQDLSVASKRAGLAGERSGLYMEQIRIIKEMRYKDEQQGRTGESIRPRYMVWENVPGAFSSNKGQDFAAVIEEAIKVVEQEAPNVPVPEKGWPTSGCIMGDHWSVAWRVLDAQFGGVPQRRRRIALVADFGGQSAPEILFIRKGVSRDLDESKQTRKATAGDVKNRTGADDRVGVPYTLKIRSGVEVDSGGKSGYPGCNQGGMAVVEPAYCIGNGQVDQLGLSEKVGTLNCMHDQQAIVIDRAFFNQGQNALYEPRCYEDGTVPTLVAKGPSTVAHGVDCRNATEYEEQTGSLQSSACHNTNSNNVVRVRYIVRRLTPLECERLQGFPDGWTDIGEWVDSKGKKHKEADSPRYKALGNSIALPPWKWVLKRLCACYERDATMASLFDGIGGFPYIWEQLNGKGSCMWASEIEEFPIAVTKLRFGGDNNA